MAFEDDGTAWLGTLGGYSTGLVRYQTNGTVDVFNSNNSIINDSTTIWDLDIDSQGRVWICNDGLVCFDDGNFVRYDSSNSLIPANRVNSVEIDANDKIWVTSWENGYEGALVSIDGDQFTLYTMENSSLPSYVISDMVIDSNNELWLLYNNKITHFDGSTWTDFQNAELGFTPYMMFRFSINSKDEICGLVEYTASSAMYAYLNQPVVYQFNGQSSDIALGDSTSFYSRIFVDSDDNIWCSSHLKTRVYSAEGLNKFNDLDLGHDTFIITESPDGKMWMSGDQIVYIYNK
jgi:ligand-binding sensor domain-containing protein